MMQKHNSSWMICGILFLPALASAQTKMKVVMGQQEIGEATFSYHLTENGSKTMESRMSVTMFGKDMTITQTTTINALGVPTRRVQEIKVKSPRATMLTIAEFFENGARVVVDKNGSRTPTNVELPKGYTITDPSEFWFFRDRPSVGQKVESYSLNLESQKWEKVEIVYEGRQTVKIDGKSYPGHKIVSTKAGAKSTMIVDDKGRPIQMDGPMGFRMERAK